MAYKFKPQKSVVKRFKVTATGKLKHHREKTSHLMSNRSAGLKRKLGKPAILAHGHSINLRKYMGVAGMNPRKLAHEHAVANIQAAKAEGSGAAE